MKPLQGLALLLLMQSAGEALSHFLQLPVPGPVVGMVLLLLALLQTRGWRGDYRPLLYAAAPLLPVLQDWRLLRRALKPKLAPSD